MKWETCYWNGKGKGNERGGYIGAMPATTPETASLLDLAFLVDDVLAHHRIILLEFHLVRGVALVLVGGVVNALALAVLVALGLVVSC